MNKFILIDKPEGQSSFDIIRDLKKEYNHSDFGHTGTLDPLATGLLLLASGKEALKAIRFVNAEDKEYIATIKLGIKTNTGDITGTVLEKKEVSSFNEWENLFKFFIGRQLQIPPKYSAKKINGKRAYELARSNKEFNLNPVEIEVKELELIDSSEKEIKFRALVSKGTFIRVLCEEIAEKSNNVGTMKSLRRTKVGKFSVEDIRINKFINILDVISLEKFEISNDQYKKIKLGQRFFINKSGIIALVFQNQLVSVVEMNNGVMKIIRNFNLI